MTYTKRLIEYIYKQAAKLTELVRFSAVNEKWDDVKKQKVKL